MKLIKSFLSIMILAVCAAFNVPGQTVPQLVVTVPVKTEKIEYQSPAKVTATNFVRTDSLVMYESANPAPAERTAVLIMREKFSLGTYTYSKFFRLLPTPEYKLVFVYV